MFLCSYHVFVRAFNQANKETNNNNNNNNHCAIWEVTNWELKGKQISDYLYGEKMSIINLAPAMIINR